MRANTKACRSLRRREFGHLGEVFQGFQAEVLEEYPGGAVQDGTAGDVFSADDLDEAAFEQAPQEGAGLHAANVIHLRAENGLAVGDDG